jgi:hypothetical protein
MGVVRRCFWALLLGGCAVARSGAPPLVIPAQAGDPSVASEWDQAASVESSELATVEADSFGGEAWPEFLRELSPSLLPSLLGTVVGHAPGQDSARSAVSFGRVQVAVKIEDGFAYTEVEEELVNDGGVQLEALASFRAPPGGVIVRLGLWVEDRLIEAEVVERKQATAIYEGIVAGSRDPALLEREPSGLLQLRVFPVPAHGARRVVVGYVQALERRENRYYFDLGLTLAEGAPPLRELSAQVELVGIGAEQIEVVPDQPPPVVEAVESGTRVRWASSRVRPSDWHVDFAAPPNPLTTFVPAKGKGGQRFAALRVAPDLPGPSPQRDASVWLIDTSVGQDGPALDVSKAVVAKLLQQLPRGERFAVLACDTACTSFPQHGLAEVTADARGAAERFVAGLQARGASDIGYALFEALQHTQGRARAQVVYFGDARPTAGDLHADEMRQRLAARGELLDLRLVGVGAALESASLTEMAARFTAARTIVNGGAEVAAHLARWLAQPILRVPTLALPRAFESAYPRQLPNLVRGDELLVLARLGRPPADALHGELEGVFDNGIGPERHAADLSLELPRRELRTDSVPRLWAHARLRDLDDDEAPAAQSEMVEQSMRYQVLSRRTSLLALESDAMFRTFGIEQRFGRADFGPTPAIARPRPRAAPAVSRTHRVPVPKVRMAGTKVSGRLPPQPIQQVVRRNDGRFRACYHDGLLKDPHLAGTVTTRFLIGRDGAVAYAVDAGSTLGDRSVIDCIVRAFKTLTFPAPDSLVTVIYPFTLSPSTSKEQRMLATPWTSRPEPPPAMIAPLPVPPAPSAPAQRVSGAELAAQVELEPTNVGLQLAAAQAYEAERSERRACAHFRAAATLAPRDLDSQYQALRCRARVLGERVSVLADVERLELRSPSIDALAARIRTLAAIPGFAVIP